jgi:hypothetical protein
MVVGSKRNAPRCTGDSVSCFQRASLPAGSSFSGGDAPVMARLGRARVPCSLAICRTWPASSIFSFWPMPPDTVHGPPRWIPSWGSRSNGARSDDPFANPGERGWRRQGAKSAWPRSLVLATQGWRPENRRIAGDLQDPEQEVIGLGPDRRYLFRYSWMPRYRRWIGVVARSLELWIPFADKLLSRCYPGVRGGGDSRRGHPAPFGECDHDIIHRRPVS